MKNSIRIVAIMLLATMSVTMIFGCSSKKTNGKSQVVPMEKEEVVKESYDFIGGDDVMPIAGFMGFDMTWYSADGNMFEDYVTEEHAKKIADSGINTILYSDHDYAVNPEMVIKGLELAEKYGLAYLVNDSFVSNMGSEGEIDMEVLANRIAEYSDYPAFGGMYLVDEPNSPNFMPELGDKFISKYVKVCEALQELNVVYDQAILPCYEYDKMGEPEKYEAYIQEYLDGFKPRVLAYDHYPFDPLSFNKPLELDEYFWNMDLIREYAIKYNIPWFNAIQAGGQWNDAQERFDSVEIFPNEGQFAWNVNTTLAFGAKMVEFFPLTQPAHFAWAKSQEWDFERNGIIGAAGNLNRWYYYLQNISKQIREIDGVLMNSVSKGVITSGEQAAEDMQLTRSSWIKSGKFQELQGVTGDAMIGCFNYQGKTALYVVNYDMEYAQKITLQLDAKHNVTMIQNAETSYVKGKNITLDMSAGEGVLLVIE